MFSKEKSKDIFLLSTEIDNVFLSEYLPQAPANYVKVYLYGLFYCENDLDISDTKMAKVLGLSEAELDGAWSYWENLEIIKRDEDGNVIFLNLRGTLKKTERYEKLNDESLKETFDEVEETLGRELTPREIKTISSWVTDFDANLDVIRGAFEYCQERGKLNINYVEKVVMEWNARGLNRIKDIRDYLESTNERQGEYKKILSSLGFMRLATPAEKKLINKWIDEEGFELERILEACEKASFIQNPNLKYVNQILENWYEEAKAAGRNVNQKITVTQAVLNKYYDFLRNEAEEKAENRRKEVYDKVPEISEIDLNLNFLSGKISRGLLGGSSKEELDEMRKKMRNLEQERAILLTENNFNVNYTDIKYSCEKCSDTGFDENGQRCSCAKERIGEAEIWQKTQVNRI